MTLLALATQPAVLMSIAKPLLVLLAMAGWAACVCRLDNDASRFYKNRRRFNALHLLGGALGLLAMLGVPFFLVGFPLGLAVLAGSLLLYARYHNRQTPPQEHWQFSAERLQTWWKQRQDKSVERAAAVRLKSAGGDPIPLPHGQDPDVPAHQALEDILLFAVPRGAERVDLVADGQQAKLVTQIDGVANALTPPEPRVLIQMVDYLKAAAGIDLDERRRRQTGRLFAQVDHPDHGTTYEAEIEVATAGSTRGVQLQMLLDPDASAEIPFPLLGLLPQQRAHLEEVLDSGAGLTLLAQEKGSGNTTTQYAILGRFDPYINSVVSVEPDERTDLEGVDRHVIGPSAPAGEFNDQLGTILRSDPSVVSLYRIADGQTLTMCAEIAGEMSIVLALPAADTSSALQTYLKAVNDHETAANRLSAVVAQRLARRLCTTCRVPFSPDPAALQKLKLTPDRAGTLYRASGKVLVGDKEQECPDCMGMGYRGRVGVFEVMPLDDAARRFIAAGQLDQLKSHLRKLGMVYLQEAALEKVVEGITDIREVQRVLKKDKR